MYFLFWIPVLIRGFTTSQALFCHTACGPCIINSKHIEPFAHPNIAHSYNQDRSVDSREPYV
jgi:hypothetical protein